MSLGFLLIIFMQLSMYCCIRVRDSCFIAQFTNISVVSNPNYVSPNWTLNRTEINADVYVVRTLDFVLWHLEVFRRKDKDNKMTNVYFNATYSLNDIARHKNNVFASLMGTYVGTYTNFTLKFPVPAGTYSVRKLDIPKRLIPFRLFYAPGASIRVLNIFSLKEHSNPKELVRIAKFFADIKIIKVNCSVEANADVS